MPGLCLAPWPKHTSSAPHTLQKACRPWPTRSASDPARRPRSPFPRCFAKRRAVAASPGSVLPARSRPGNGPARTATGALTSFPTAQLIGNHGSLYVLLGWARLVSRRTQVGLASDETGAGFCSHLPRVPFAMRSGVRCSWGALCSGLRQQTPRILPQRDGVCGVAPRPSSAHASFVPAAGQTQGQDETTTQPGREVAPASGKKGA